MITPEELAEVKDFDSLAALFYEKLAWPLENWSRFDGVAKLYDIPENDIEGIVDLSAVTKLADDQTWGIFVVDFGTNVLKGPALREILNRVAQKARQTHDNPVWPHENILFIIRHDTDSFSFAHFRGDKLANAKLRRFGWTNHLEARTAIENLSRLRWGADWSEAFNVEKLTKDFFTKLSDLFYDASDALADRFPDENERRLFVQTLFNRLIFLRFVEKKEWLKLGEPANERPDYLRALWEAGQDSINPFWPTRLNALFGAVNHPTSDNVHEVSRPIIGNVPYLNGGLFDDDPRFADPTVHIPEHIFQELLGTDGIFYRYNFTVEESSPLDVQVAVDPEILGKIFEQLTISEKRHDTGSYYTPREIVQFMCREALVGYLSSKGLVEDKARKLVYEHDDSELSNPEGTMAFNALKEVKVVDPACGSGAYLLGMLQELYVLFEKLRRDDQKFSDDPAKEEHDRKLWIIENNIYGVDIQAFATNTAMLRLWLTLLVEDTSAIPQPLPNLEYKIETGDSLLGPDPSEPIDWSRQKKGEQAGLDVWDKAATIRELRDLRSKYQNAHGTEKDDRKDELESKLAELREKVTGSRVKYPAKFDWRVEFFDVFLDDPAQRRPGFDAVLANPPYVRQELIKDIKPDLKARYGENFSGTADLYTFFYIRAIQLLAPGGMLVFISSNKWFRAGYGKKLRAFMASQTCVRSITDFGELPVFSAATFPMIFVAQKRVSVGPFRAGAEPFRAGAEPFRAGAEPFRAGAEPFRAGAEPFRAGAESFRAGAEPSSAGAEPSSAGAKSTSGGAESPAAVFTQVKSLDPPYPDVLALIEQSGFELPEGAIRGSEYTLADAQTSARLRQMERAGVPLGEYVKGKIYYGIKTGFNEAFVIDGAKRAELIAEDPKSAEIIKPLAVGDDVRRWRIRERDRWLIFTRRGIDIDAYPAIKRHLAQWKDELTPKVTGKEPKGRKPGRYKWYEIQDDIAYYAEFDKPKIVFPDIAMESRFAFDRDRTFVSNTTYMAVSDDLFLAGVLNSGPMWWYCGEKLTVIGDVAERGRLRFFSQFVELIPIPRASDADRDAIAALVQKCLDVKAADADADVSADETEIDKRVEFLYFDRDPEAGIDTYEEWIAQQERERGTVIEEIRNLVAAGESGGVEFKRSLEAPDLDHPTIAAAPENVRPAKIAETKRNLIHSVLKTIGAFRNREDGGTLLIGVTDDGNIAGLQADYDLLGAKKDKDGFENKLTDLIKTRITPIPVNLDIKFAVIGGKEVCVIKVLHGPPTYVDNRLYVRISNSTEELTGRDLQDWLDAQ